MYKLFTGFVKAFIALFAAFVCVLLCRVTKAVELILLAFGAVGAFLLVGCVLFMDRHRAAAGSNESQFQLLVGGSGGDAIVFSCFDGLACGTKRGGMDFFCTRRHAPSIGSCVANRSYRETSLSTRAGSTIVD